MRKRNMLVLVASSIALTAAGSAGAGSGGAVASASGGNSFSGPAAGSSFVIHPFAWHVQIHADGTVAVKYAYTQLRDGVELEVSGPLHCAVVIGNRVWVGGLIEKAPASRSSA